MPNDVTGFRPGGRERQNPLTKRAARAICHDFGVDPDRWVSANDDVLVEAGVRDSHHAWERYISMVREVLGAIREPSDHMVDHGDDALRHHTRIRQGFAEHVWRAMVDEALCAE